MNTVTKVVTRIAPSPTGFLHFGLARTALYSFLYARQKGGTFIIRIEDTDKARNKPEYEKDIFEQLSWLGLSGDLIYRQSENNVRHQECLQKMIKEDTAYISREPAKDNPAAFVDVVRLRNPGGTVTFHDTVRGNISFDVGELKDFVIARSITDPLYHMAVVIDDADEGVTHVIRGDDHISNTPRQILIQRALGFPLPEYTHLPLILMPDKSKMSKRKHETAVMNYREKGILPEAMINYLALLGWTPKGDVEILSLAELIDSFDLESIHKSGAVFDVQKLLWFNREYLRALPEVDFAKKATEILATAARERGFSPSPVVLSALVPLLRERVSVWSDIKTQTEAGEYDFFFTDPLYKPFEIPDKKSDAKTAALHLRHTLGVFTSAATWDASTLKESLWDYASEHGRASVLWPLRFILTGKEKSPDPFAVASIIGKDATLRRIQGALALLANV